MSNGCTAVTTTNATLPLILPVVPHKAVAVSKIRNLLQRLVVVSLRWDSKRH